MTCPNVSDTCRTRRTERVRVPTPRRGDTGHTVSGNTDAKGGQLAVTNRREEPSSPWSSSKTQDVKPCGYAKTEEDSGSRLSVSVKLVAVSIPASYESVTMATSPTGRSLSLRNFSTLSSRALYPITRRFSSPGAVSRSCRNFWCSRGQESSSSGPSGTDKHWVVDAAVFARVSRETS